MKPTVPSKTTSDNNERSLAPPPPPITTATAVPAQYTNGHGSLPNNSQDELQTTTVQNGLSDNHIEDEIDNDDGQWSDWEPEPDALESSIDTLPPLPSSPAPPPPPTVPSQEPVVPKSTSLPSKSLKLNTTSKSKWNPNAPLGSEYEIPPVVITKSKPTAGPSTNPETEDFFKDMAPKVETVELMRQLESMFYVTTDEPNEQNKSTINRTTTTAAATFSNKFGMMSQDQDDNQEFESGNNNWDE